MQSVPFLTDLDTTRLGVVGSRDPLGVQGIWTRFGRHVVGNLSTVSNSVRDFTTLLLGYYFAELVAEDRLPGSELATFLKWEQLAAYARAHVNGDFSFRGTEKARLRLSERNGKVTLSDERVHQILANQKIYGLWGLYSVPARTSGLLEGSPPRLTAPARELVERNYLKVLTESGFDGGKRIIALLREKAVVVDTERGEGRRLLEAVAKVLKKEIRAHERGFYRHHLLYGCPADATHGGGEDSTDGRQKRLAELLASTFSSDFRWSPASVARLAERAHGDGDIGDSLRDRLNRIYVCESVLAPMTTLFTHLLGCNDVRVAVVLKRLGEKWDSGLRGTIAPEKVRLIQAELAGGVPEVGDRWVRMAEAAHDGEYETLVELLLAQSAWVMETRGGMRWIENRDGIFHVRFRDEQGALPDRDEMGGLWKHPYFLDSLRSVALALREG
ncbi:hypothetical protein BH09SUM1_BH09SUM1_18830 [soil metagenome]